MQIKLRKYVMISGLFYKNRETESPGLCRRLGVGITNPKSQIPSKFEIRNSKQKRKYKNNLFGFFNYPVNPVILSFLYTLCIWIVAGCAERKPIDVALKESSALYLAKGSVSIPLLRINAVSNQGEKSKSMVLSTQLISKWPDKLRLKMCKANYHLVSMVVNGHKASLYFPRTNKVFNTELNKPVLKDQIDEDLFPTIIEMSLMFVQGPFPRYSLSLYAVQKKEGDLYTYTADLPKYFLDLSIDSFTCKVQKQEYRFKEPHDWVIEIDFDRYALIEGSMPYPRRIVMAIYRKKTAQKKTVLEMFVSRISFGHTVSEKAFKPNWPEDALVIKEIPKKTEELFGKIEEEEDKK
jgi:outer membrane lipoprotein-sorting protein